MYETDIHANNITNISYMGSENFNVMAKTKKIKILPKY